MMKIAVAGTGYVGMSIATLLAQHILERPLHPPLCRGGSSP